MAKRLGLFLLGGACYCAIELAYRGRTHWTMAIAGGLCLVLLSAINRRMKNRSLIARCAAGGLAITAVEFVIGLIVNRLLHLNVWDYSAKPFNICGQICPQFTAAWMLICIPAMLLCSMIDGSDISFRRSQERH